MADRKLSLEEERALAQYQIQLFRLERDVRLLGRMQLIPGDWHKLHDTHPTAPHKTPLTVRYDADMVRWYKGLGRGYQARMNAVLRTYMLGVTSRDIVTLMNQYGDALPNRKGA